MYSPRLSARTMPTSALRPPRDDDPAIVPTPRWRSVREMNTPSRCREIRMLIGASYFHAFGIISIRPCQKQAINGLPSAISRSAISAFSIRQRPVSQTSRI
jgi:hypothetical protein